MTDRELMQEALDALEAALSDDQPYISCSKEAVEALRARLSQPESDPVAWGLQQQFEGKIGTAPVAFKRHDEFGFVVPLYTAPPQREWVGLTEEEFESIYATSKDVNYEYERAIEAKLKEKNT